MRRSAFHSEAHGHVLASSHIMIISLHAQEVPMSSELIELTLITQSELSTGRTERCTVTSLAMRDALVHKQTSSLFSMCRCLGRDRLVRFCNCGLECPCVSSIVPPASSILMHTDVIVTHLVLKDAWTGVERAQQHGMGSRCPSRDLRDLASMTFLTWLTWISGKGKKKKGQKWKYFT